MVQCRDSPVSGCICRIGSTDDGLSTLAYVGFIERWVAAVDLGDRSCGNLSRYSIY